MSPLVLAGLWLGAGLAGAALARATGRCREIWLALLLVAVATSRVAVGPGWPGPMAGAPGAPGLLLGQPGMGLLGASAVAVAITFLLAPEARLGELPVVCVVGAACTVLLAATSPLVWCLAVSVAMGALAVHWIAAAPGTPTMSAGRIGGVGASCMLGAASFLSPAGGPLEPRAVLSGSLLGLGLCCVLGLVPFGGWAAGTVASVRGTAIAPWGLLLVPSLILSAMVVSPQLIVGGRIPFNNALLVSGLLTGITSGVAAMRVAPHARYGRVMIADLGLAAAGVGTTHSEGRTGAFLIILTHLCIGTLLLHPIQAGLRGQRRIAWLELSGVPPAPAFWGRFLVLVGCTATAPSATIAGIVAVTLLFLVAMERGIRTTDDEGLPGPRVPWRQGVVGWGVATAGLTIGLAPGAAARAVFGI